MHHVDPIDILLVVVLAAAAAFLVYQIGYHHSYAGQLSELEAEIAAMEAELAAIVDEDGDVAIVDGAPRPEAALEPEGVVETEGAVAVPEPASAGAEDAGAAAARPDDPAYSPETHPELLEWEAAREDQEAPDDEATAPPGAPNARAEPNEPRGAPAAAPASGAAATAAAERAMAATTTAAQGAPTETSSPVATPAADETAGAPGSTAVIQLVAEPNPAPVGATVELEVLVEGAEEVFALPFQLAYDPSKLQYLSYEPGPFMTVDGIEPRTSVRARSPGLLYGGASRTGHATGASGGGRHMTLRFRTLGPADATELRFRSVTLRDRRSREQPLRAEGTTLQIR